MDLIKLRWQPGQLARNGSALLIWMLLRAIMQVGTIVLLARQLGAEQYGKVVAVIAVASFAIPFVGLGLSHLVLRNAARDPHHEYLYLARAVRWWGKTLLPCTVISIAISALLLPAGLPIAATCAVIFAELSATSLTELCARHQQARQKMHAFGAINAGLPAIRLFAFALLFFVNWPIEISSLLWIYATSSLIYTSILWITLPKLPTLPNTALPELMAAKDGLPFSLAVFATKLQAEFNKPVLAQAGFGLVGSYNVAQRAVDMASLPLMALQEALWPRLYAQQNPMRQLCRTGLALLAFAMILGASIWLAAPLLPYVLGSSFADAVPVLRLLAWLPLLQAFRALLNFHAIHLGRMQLIGWAYIIGAVASVVSVVIFVPPHGLRGAVLASYIAEATMISYLSFIAHRK